MTAAPPIINSYSNGGFTVGGDFHHGHMLITGVEETGFSISPWDVETGEGLTVDDFDPIYTAPNLPMLILIGVGGELAHPFAQLRVELSKRGIAVEIQATPAACRTWNLLLSEGRKVAFAAIAP